MSECAICINMNFFLSSKLSVVFANSNELYLINFLFNDFWCFSLMANYYLSAEQKKNPYLR